MNTIFRNFITTLRRFKMASTLNIVGLSVAFAAFLVIIMQVSFEYSFDTEAKNSEQIYRIDSHGPLVNNGQGVLVSPRPFMEEFKEIPAIEELTIIETSWVKRYITIEKNGAKVGFDEDIIEAYENFPAFFDLELIDGDFANFRDNNSIMLPRSLAIKYLDTPFAAGKSITISDQPVTIAAVFEDFPMNSQFDNSIYAFFPKDKGLDTWNQANYVTYARLAPGATTEQATEMMNKTGFKEKSDWLETVTLSPLEDIYFDPAVYYGDEFLAKKGNKDTTNILLAIAVLIIVIAGINFVNFSTSLAPLRMKSINTQKVFGSPTSTLRLALLGEAVGISVISFAISLLWIYGLAQSPWQDITLSGISFTGNSQLIIATGLLSVIVGLIAGIYPAFYTTKFPPALMLKGNFAMSRKGRQLRIALVGFQFVVSIGLIIGAIFLQIQNQFLRTADKGFSSDQVIVACIGGEIMKNQQTFENRLKESPLISDVGYCQFQLGTDNMVQGWSKEFKAGGEQQHFGVLVCSWNFPQVMGIEFLEGDPLKEIDLKNNNVPQHYIFNKTAKERFGFSVGDKLDVQQESYNEIRAVVKNFNFKTMRMTIEPMAIVVNNWTNQMPFAYVRAKGDPMAAMNHVKNVANTIDPTYPTNVYFYDESFEQLYAQDLKTTSLIMFFSMLAILISLVGVFGLVLFETQYKRKEIGVRKIMGSTVGQILIMLNRKFVYIVIVCFIIAVPLAYLGVDAWLGGFAYRTPMAWWVFAAGGIIVFVITITTVTIQSYRAATENPVNSLKSE